MKKDKIIFMGTTSFAAYLLQGLIDNGYNIVGVVSKVDKEVGRKKEVKFSSVKEVALKNNIDLFQPFSIKEDYSFIEEKNPDLILTCAYGELVPEYVLNIPKKGSLNVHASLLPKYRGAAPIEYSILNDETKTGVSLMKMIKRMDAGEVYSTSEVNISDEDNRESLAEKLKISALNLLLSNLDLYLEGNLKGEEQNEKEVSFAPSIKREEEHLDFSKTRRSIYNKIRALNPKPYANVILLGEELKIIEAKEINEDFIGEVGEIVAAKKRFIVKCKDGCLEILKVKPFSKKEMDAKSFINGKNNLLGEIFL